MKSISQEANMRRIRLDDIRLAIQRGTDFLVRNYVQTADSCGWHQYLGDHRAGPPATIMGLEILYFAKRDFKDSPSAKQSVYKDQMEDGGWTIRSINQYSITESTAWVISGFQRIGEPINERILSGLQWLINNQNEDGGWGAIKGLDSRIHTSYWASTALSLSRLYPETLYKTSSWLKTIQNRDGGWGSIKGGVSTAQHTACGILTLLNCGEVISSGLVRAGVNWLVQNYRPGLNWEWSEHSEEYDIVLGPKNWDRIRLRHYPTQWAMLALLETSEGVFNPEVFDGVKWLLANQHEEGYWQHPMISDKISIWAIHDSIQVLRRFVDGFGQDDEVGYIDLYKDIVVFTRKGTYPSFRKLLWLETKSLVQRWIKYYWSVALVVLYLILIYPLYKWAGISIKDILLGVILPLFLVFFQYLLDRQTGSRRK